MQKRIISTLLAVVMLFACLPINISAAETVADATIIVDSVTSPIGATVDVSVRILGNPGIAGATFTLKYNENLTLIQAASGQAFDVLDFTNPGSFTNPCNFTWDSENAIAASDGVFLTLTFEIADTVEKNEKLNVDISYRRGDVFNDEIDLTLDIVNGNVIVLDYIPGDIYEDGVINAKDTRLLRQYIAGGYDISINEAAADVNADCVINTKDTRLIRRFIAGGYDVELKPSLEWCTHELTATAAKAATCEEDGNIAYWHCAKCNRYYDDEEALTKITYEETVVPKLNHNEVIIPAIPATEEEHGWTEGLRCDRCEKITKEPEPIYINQYTISYYNKPDDSYLKQEGNIPINPNPTIYTSSSEAIPLDDIEEVNSPAGYDFLGWFDKQGNLMTEIPAYTEGNLEIYAHWEKDIYDVIYDSPLVPIPSAKDEGKGRTVDQEYYLTEDMKVLSWPGYTFMGWSDDYGRIITKIPAGTAENVTVHANWTSNRSMAKANDYVSTGPIILEPDDVGENAYYFVYDLGMLVNVPLKTLYNHGNHLTENWTEKVEIKTVFGVDEATTVNTAISNATTKSSSWTLSTDWNEILTTENSGGNELTNEQVLALSTGTSKAYSSSAEVYEGHSFHASNDSKVTSKTITDASFEHSSSYGAEIPIEFLNVSAKTTNTIGVSQSHEKYNENKTHMENSGEWNTTNSYSESGSFNLEGSVSNRVASTAHNEWKHATTKAIGGSDTNVTSDSLTTTSNNEYGYSTMYHKTEESTKTVTLQLSSDTQPGYYRYILAGDFYVYAIVRYDVETGAFSVYNQSVMADETREMWDYSKSDPQFEDYNNAVLPFEVPIDVFNYLFDTIGVTDGLDIDIETGMVTDYTGDAKNVFIPDYHIVNQGDGEIKVIKVTGIENGAFTDIVDGKVIGKNIELVKLNSFIDTIPAEAFKNCTSLKTIEYTNLRAIGQEAFSGCTSFEGLTIDEGVTNLGNDAFDEVGGEIIVTTNDKNIVNAALTSSANKMTVNLKTLVLSDTTLEPQATDTFVLNAFGNTYSNVNIKSNAKSSTVINRVTLKNNIRTPLDLSSANVTLNQVIVENAPGFAVKLSADDTVVTLQGKVKLSTNYDHAVLGKNITLTKIGNITTEFNLNNKNILVCGTFKDVNGYLKDATVKYISEAEYENLLTSHYVTFDANGGTVSEAQRQVTNDTFIGELPIPTRDDFTFVGWFKEDGTQVTADTVMNLETDITLKAYWRSGWVLASKLPAGASVEKTKWTYDLTTTKESDKSTMSGWTLYDKKITSYGETQGAVYTDPSNGERKVWSEQYVSSTTTHYVYYHKYNGSLWGDEDSLKNSGTIHQIDITKELPYYETGKTEIEWCKGDACSECGQKYRWKLRETYVEEHYSTRWYYQEPVYTYYFTKTEKLESTTEVTATGNISNVQKYVQYIIK